MESTNNFYDDVREGNTTQTNAPAITQAQDSQTKISDSIIKWASRIFTGWVIAPIAIADTMFNYGNLITGLIGSL